MRSKNTVPYAILTAIGLTFWLGTQPAPAFVTVTVQPTEQVVFVGSNAVFSAQATATAGEIITGYTWLTSPTGLNPFTVVPGATTATCTLVNVQTNDTGYYFVRVAYNSGTNIGLTTASAAVRLVVPDQARIIVQPTSLSRLVGTSASFTVSAMGFPPPGYQWRFNRTNLVENARVAGVNGTNLTLTGLLELDSGSYDVVVTNLYSAVTSQVATLGVFIPVGISVPPQNTTVILGSNAELSVTATGTGLSYQWQHEGTNLVEGGRISGAAGSLLTIAAAMTNDAGGYTVYVFNPASSTNAAATLTVLVPATFTSPTNAIGRQGLFFSFTNRATGTTPIYFGADGLPAGLSIEPTNGVISGVPAVSGNFNITVYATNAAMATTGQLALTLTTGAPGITSRLTARGKQGLPFGYTITSTNGPVTFSTSLLPEGLNLNPVTGTITGRPLVGGLFPVTISAINLYGSDSQVLALTITSSVPVIRSPLTASATQNLSGFTYTIQASESPTEYGASNLPSGLSVDPATGIISGTPWQGGTFTVPISAVNAWGRGTTNLVLTVNYATLSGLAITNVTTNWSKPYLLDFSFTLRDGSDATNNPVVRSPSQLQVVCMEDGVPISGEEAPYILQSVMGSGSKQLKTFLALDYTYSMYSVPGAIDAMEAAAGLLITQEPPHAMFGIIEFNADYMAPRFVTNSLTTANNYFITDKTVLTQSIAGIRTNYVQGNYAGTRCWDAMYAALQQFGANNPDEARYLVAMTDGNDDSSLLNTTSDPMGAVTNLYQLAQANHVAIYCVGFGVNINTNALQMLTAQTGGRYYVAATTDDLPAQFQRIQNDMNSQYVLRWATLRRTTVPAYPVPGFQPSFQITCDGITDSWNTNIVTTNITLIDTNQDPPLTNSYTTNVVQFPYDPPAWSNDVRVGSLRLVQDADIGPQTIRLRATYVPRYVREVRLNYRPNYPCTASVDSTGTNELLYGWSLTETTDTNGLRTLTMTSSNPADPLTSIRYAAFGDLLSFNFTYPESVTATQAFSVFTIDNSVYTNMPPSGQSFVLQNATNFITLYPPAPPHGTPVPWLIYYGYKTNFAAAELIATNGLPVWEAYIAGLNPTNATSRFTVSTAFGPGQVPQIIFSTVATRTYRVESSIDLERWQVLLDNIPGTGGNMLFIDNRALTSVNSVFYRVGVY